MNLDWTEEQVTLREMVRGLCAEYAPIAVVRRMEDDPKGYTDEFWKQQGQLGLLGLLIPEEYGGAAQSLLDAAIVYEEFGRALAPSPHFPSSVLGAGALLAAGSEAQKRTWLPKLATGEALFTPAWREPARGCGPLGVQLRAERKGEGWALSGLKRHVLFASSATRLLVLARSGPGESDIGLFLVDPAARGVSLSQQRSLAADSQYDVRFADTPVPADSRIGPENSGWSSWERVMNDAIVLLAAWAVGGAERALEITAQYAKDRKQFDKPLGAFQALAHYLADAATAIDGAKTLVYEAAWARAEGKSTARLAPMANLFACQTYRDVTAMCQQVWGGVGFTIEYDIQLYFRRAKQLQLAWWDARWLEEKIAASLLDPGAAPVRTPI